MKSMCVFLSLCLLFSISFLSNANMMDSSFQTYIQNEHFANEYHTTMMLHFEEYGYPDNFGGSYIDEVTGHLTIKLINNTASEQRYYYDLCNTKNLQFVSATYSLNELYAMQINSLKNPVDILSLDKSINVVGSAIIQKDSKIEVYIDSVSYIPITTTYSKSSSLEYSPFIIKPSAYLSKHSGTGCPGSGVS
ncbi:MAG: hypothetical protein IJO47_08620, partial [Clostridia bacterium]|nr:hypothetical protein [Clostridia bacterium]